MMTRRSAAESMVSVRPTDIASVAELIPSSSRLISAANRVRGTEKGWLQLRKHGGCEVAKTKRLCSTRPQNFSNARDSSLLGLFVPALLFPDQLRDRPEGGGELGRRFVAGASERYRNDFLHCSGTIGHHHHPVGEDQRFLDAVRHEHDRLLELCPDPEQFVLHR